MQEKIAPYHTAILIYMSQSGVVIFSMPRLLAETFGTNGYLVLFGFGLISALNLWIISRVPRFCKGKSIFDVLEAALPKIILYPVYLFIAATWAILGCMVAKQYVLIFQMMSFPTTSPMIFKLVVSTLAFLLLIKGIYSIVKAITMFYWMILWMNFLMLFFIPDLELSRLTTFFFKEGHDPLKGTLDIYTAFLGYEICLLLLPFFDPTGNWHRAAQIGNLMSTLVYFTASLMCFTFFSFGQLRSLTFPLLDTLAYIRLPFIERLENLLYSFLLLNTLDTSVLYYWSAKEALQRMFKPSKRILISFIIVFGTYSLSFIPTTIRDVQNWLSVTGHLTMYIAFLLPLMVIGAAWMKRKEQSHGQG